MPTPMQQNTPPWLPHKHSRQRSSRRRPCLRRAPPTSHNPNTPPPLLFLPPPHLHHPLPHSRDKLARILVKLAARSWSLWASAFFSDAYLENSPAHIEVTSRNPLGTF